MIKIDNNTFANCSGFTGALTIPSGVATIGHDAFAGCTGFTGTLILPSELISIEDLAFYQCYYITGITIGDKLVSIGERAFAFCQRISGEIIFPLSLKSIKQNAFSSFNIKAVRFPHTTPITYESGMLPLGAQIQVPSSAVSTYKSTPGWKDRYIVGY